MEIIVLGVICLGQAIYLHYLVNKLSKLQTLLAMLREGMIKIAEGEMRVVRTTDGVRFEMAKGN